jgi:uncharacterized protein DUF1707/cell wall-active antibiotic response 4TMS protein YvqF
VELERSGGSDHIRVSDREREQIVELLGQAAAEGRLTLDEYADRAGWAYAARTRGELARLTEDLPVVLPPAADGAVQPYPPRPAARPPAAGPPAAHDRLVAVFGNESRKGSWPVPERLEAWSVFGDCHIELQDAALQHHTIVIEATAIFGSVTVFVPEGVDVRLSGTALFGSKESRLRGPVRPGAPLIEVRTRVIFGAVTVRPPRQRGW